MDSVDDAFAQLSLRDSELHLRAAIARAAKRRSRPVPAGVDARYLLGIFHDLGAEREGVAIAHKPLRTRLDARDRTLPMLVLPREKISAGTSDPRACVLRFVDLALAVNLRVGHICWLLGVAHEINLHVKCDVAPLVDTVARRVHVTHRVSYRECQDGVLAIVTHVAPLPDPPRPLSARRR